MQINVNLKPCTCRYPNNGAHRDACVGAPVLIPCPIPRSVTFEVRLGECACFKRNYVAHDKDQLGHADYCPARSVRVSCSISGKTWAESEVSDFDFPVSLLADMVAANRVLASCRERWALVKALVLEQWPTASSIGVLSEAIPGLATRRDAVYSALADMARAEEAAFQTQYRCDQASPAGQYLPTNAKDHRGSRPSEARLAAFVAYLIDTVRGS